MAKNPSYQEWIASANERDRALGERQQAWNARRQEDAKGEAAAQLAALEAAWNTAHLKSDAAALDRLWADDIEIFVPRMRPMGKAEALATFKDGGTTFSRFETSDVHPRVTGDLAVVTGRLQRTRNVSGRVAVGGLAVPESLPARRLRMARDQLSRLGAAAVAADKASLGCRTFPLFREGLRDLQRNRRRVRERGVRGHGHDDPAFGKRDE